MLPQNFSFNQSQNAIFPALKKLQISKMLYHSNIRKGFSIPVFEVFQRLVMLMFYGKNLFRSSESKPEVDHRTNGWKARMSSM